MAAKDNALGKIAINGKFLGANLNGVHRTAAHYSQQLLRRAGEMHQIRLLAPRAVSVDPAFPELEATPVPGRFGKGQGWEMLTLPQAAQGELLLNFCNLGPLLHSNSIVMIHDAQTFLFPDDYSGRQAAFYRLLLPWIGRRARRVLTVSEFSRQMLARYRIGTLDTIDVVHNGTDHILSEPSDEAIIERLGLAGRRYVMAVGSAKGYKNMRAIFEAMREPFDEDVALVVAGGPGEEAYRAKGWAPPAGTIFTGFVSDGELRALYSAAAVFVFPSLTEGFGLPPVEAMHCGCPVVAARAGAMPEVLGDAAVLVAADQPGEYREAIAAFLGDSARAQDYRQRGFARAATLTWDRAGERLHALVEKLL